MKVKLVNEPIGADYGRSILRARGIEDVDTFLNPTSSSLQDWRDLDNIEAGAKILEGLARNSKVGLVVDSDCDGYTSAAIIYNYLKAVYGDREFEIHVYIHEKKAHGLEEHWREMLEENFDLVIVPDAGSNDQEYVEKFKCPIIIIDHHLVDNLEFPSNMIVINNQLSERYHNKFLSGAGMAYQFCRALDFYNGAEKADDFIDLAALGIVGDMMSGLEVENQYIWREGFTNVTNPFFMALALKQAYSITGKTAASWGDICDALDPTSVAFYIVPLINAMVRVGTMAEKERMFLAFTDGHKLIPCNKRGAKGTLEEACVESTRECVNARSHQNKFLDTATEILEQKIFKYDLLENKILFIRLDEENFPSELNGLIAMRLSQKYKHPTIVARLGEDGFIKGSARGLNNSELSEFKSYLTNTGLFDYAQGHEGAFGVSIPAANLARLHEFVNKDLANIDFNSDYYEVNFERQAHNNDLPALISDLDNYKHIWSQGNAQPLIYVKDLHVTWDEIQIMGRNEDTIKIMKNGISYMKFFGKAMIEELKQYSDIKMEIVGKPNMNEWMGVRTPQIFIESYEIKWDDPLSF